MKKCSKCKNIKSLNEFHKNVNRKDGYQSNCITCRKVIDHESYKKSSSRQERIKERREIVRGYNRNLMTRYKTFCGCYFCPERTPIALDLHHLNPDEKDINPSSGVNYATKTLKNEIRKCVVLCANCHRKVHAGLLTL